MRKELQRRASGGKPVPRKLEREENPLVAAIIDRQIPSRAKMLLVGLALSAFESPYRSDLIPLNWSGIS